MASRCIEVRITTRPYNESMVVRYEATVTCVHGDVLTSALCPFPPVFTGACRHEAVGKLVASAWATKYLFRNGKQACLFTFEDMQ